MNDWYVTSSERPIDAIFTTRIAIRITNYVSTMGKFLCIEYFSETDIINMLDFLTDNIFVLFLGRVFQQTVGIPMGTSCASLLADLFRYSYEADFMQRLLRKNEKKLDRSFNFRFCYIDDVLSLSNSRFGDTLIVSIPLSLKQRIRQVQIQIGLLYILTYTSKLIMRGG